MGGGREHGREPTAVDPSSSSPTAVGSGLLLGRDHRIREEDRETPCLTMEGREGGVVLG